MIVCYILQSDTTKMFYGRDYKGDETWFTSFQYADQYASLDEAEYMQKRAGGQTTVRLLTLVLGDV